MMRLLRRHPSNADTSTCTSSTGSSSWANPSSWSKVTGAPPNTTERSYMYEPSTSFWEQAGYEWGDPNSSLHNNNIKNSSMDSTMAMSEDLSSINSCRSSPGRMPPLAPQQQPSGDIAVEGSMEEPSCFDSAASVEAAPTTTQQPAEELDEDLFFGPSNAVDAETCIELTMAVPGFVGPSDLDVQVNHQMHTLGISRTLVLDHQNRQFTRSFPFDHHTLDAHRVSAAYESNVLVITIPKKQLLEQEAQMPQQQQDYRRSIPIQEDQDDQDELHPDPPSLPPRLKTSRPHHIQSTSTCTSSISNYSSSSSYSNSSTSTWSSYGVGADSHYHQHAARKTSTSEFVSPLRPAGTGAIAIPIQVHVWNKGKPDKLPREVLKPSLNCHKRWIIDIPDHMVPENLLIELHHEQQPAALEIVSTNECFRKVLPLNASTLQVFHVQVYLLTPEGMGGVLVVLAPRLRKTERQALLTRRMMMTDGNDYEQLAIESLPRGTAQDLENYPTTNRHERNDLESKSVQGDMSQKQRRHCRPRKAKTRKPSEFSDDEHHLADNEGEDDIATIRSYPCRPCGRRRQRSPKRHYPQQLLPPCDTDNEDDDKAQLISRSFSSSSRDSRERTITTITTITQSRWALPGEYNVAGHTIPDDDMLLEGEI